MVRRAALLMAGLAFLAGCGPRLGGQAAGDMKLQGFTVLDPARRQARQRDLWIVQGKLALQAPPGSEHWPVLDGKGRYLLPSFWDLFLASWGNAATKDYHILEQGMGADTLSKALLYAGVGHGVAVMGNGGWYQKSLKRNQAMGTLGADCLRSSRIFCAPVSDSSGTTLSSLSEVGPAVALQLSQNAVYLCASFNHSSKSFPALSRPLLAEVLRLAKKSGKPSLVRIGDAAEGEEALSLGAAGLMSGPITRSAQALFRHMAAHKAAWIPSLAATLDLRHMEGPEGVLADPLANALVRPDVMDDYRNVAAYDTPSAETYAREPALEAPFLKNLAQARDAGVLLLQGSGAGASAGVFQGIGVHRQMAWMLKAGLSPWEALASATTAPAAWLGRSGGLDSGAPADFCVLDANPLDDIRNTERIVGVCQDGCWAERSRLLPDLWRRHY
jgi:hypothetical protein